MNFDTIHKLYFVGIGGIGMSATAGLASKQGFEIFGSDSKEVYAPSKDVLDDFGIPYVVGYDAKHIQEHPAEVYVISAGEDLHNPEVAYIVEHKLPYVSFPELLHYLAKDSLRIVVTGTHGKSTTTGLLGHLLKNLDDSSFMTGGVLVNYNTNFYLGGGHYFVFEGDEYKSLFDDPTPKAHYYKADILVLTNLEFDHPDVFSNLEEVKHEFRLLIENMPDDGLIVYNADDANLQSLMHETNVANFGFSLHNDSHFFASDIAYGPEFTDFALPGPKKDSPKEHYQTALVGQMNLYNAVAAVATLRALGFDPSAFTEALKEYKGVKRRFEVIGKKNNITIIDDYAHHPTAVKETLDAARTKFTGARIWAIFEPHTFSRTAATLPDLVTSFGSADQVLLADIYPARENVLKATISPQQVFEAVVKEKPETRRVANKQEALDILKKEVKPGDVVIVMAVGSFNRLAYKFLETL